MKRGTLIVGGVTLVAAGLALIRPSGAVAPSSSSSAAKPAAPAAKSGGGLSFGMGDGTRKVEVLTPRRGPIASVIEASGTVRAGSETGVGAPFEGRIIELLKDEGDAVAVGDVLFRLDPADAIQRADEMAIDLERKTSAREEARIERETCERKQTDSVREPSDVTEARLKARQSELSLQRAQAQVESAQNKLTRARTLRAQGIGTPIDVESAESEHRVSEISVRIAQEEKSLATETLEFRERSWAEARADADKNLALSRAREGRARNDLKAAEVALARAKRDLDRCEIRATLDGVVTGRNVNQGDQVVRATGEVTHYIISDTTRILIYADVDEGDVVQVARGQRARARVNALGDDVKLEGAVYDVGHRGTTKAGAETTSFRVRVLLAPDQAAAARLRPGMTATSEVETASDAQALKVPLQAIVQREVQSLPQAVRDAAPPEALAGKRPSDLVDVVFVVVGDALQQKVVLRGIQDDDEAQVTAPALDPANALVVGPFRQLERLADGDKVHTEEAPLALPPDAAATTSASGA